MDKYRTYLKKCDFYYCSELKMLPKLSIKEILKYEEPYKMALLFFYGYSSMYKKYELIDLNRYINIWSDINLYLFLIYCGNIKEIKYLVSKGINIHNFKYIYNAYLIAVYNENIRLMKYLESIGVNIHKKSYGEENAYLIATLCRNIKLMKHLEKKGVDIYSRDTYGENYMEKYWKKYNKFGIYVFKNMNYKLNRFKMCFIGPPHKIDLI